MRLSQLSPRWIAPNNWAAKEPFHIGVSFLCPHCGAGPCPTCGHTQDKRLAVMFSPPIDPTDIARTFMVKVPDNGAHRRVRGETFESLTLSPSIGFDDPPHFHGTITDGEVVNHYPNAPWVAENESK